MDAGSTVDAGADVSTRPDVGFFDDHPMPFDTARGDGGAPPPVATSSCGCRAAGVSRTSAALVALSLLLGVLGRRRSRR